MKLIFIGTLVIFTICFNLVESAGEKRKNPSTRKRSKDPEVVPSENQENLVQLSSGSSGDPNLSPTRHHTHKHGPKSPLHHAPPTSNQHHSPPASPQLAPLPETFSGPLNHIPEKIPVNSLHHYVNSLSSYSLPPIPNTYFDYSQHIPNVPNSPQHSYPPSSPAHTPAPSAFTDLSSPNRNAPYSPSQHDVPPSPLLSPFTERVFESPYHNLNVPYSPSQHTAPSSPTLHPLPTSFFEVDDPFLDPYPESYQYHEHSTSPHYAHPPAHYAHPPAHYSHPPAHYSHPPLHFSHPPSPSLPPFPSSFYDHGGPSGSGHKQRRK